MRDHIRFLRRGDIVELNDVKPTDMLLTYLREVEGSRGTKEGCNEGDCGACSVVLARWQEGKIHYAPINACIFPMAMLDGAWLLTVEDWAAEGGKLHPMQQAVVDHHGSQCGFCTPGFISTMIAGQLRQDSASPETLMAGNLCRCTGYGGLIKAYEATKETAQPDWIKAQIRSAEKILPLLQGGDFELKTEQGTIYAPSTVTDFAAYRAENPDALIVAGATDVGLWITKRLDQPRKLLMTGFVQELKAITVSKEQIILGAAVTYEQAQDVLMEDFPEAQDWYDRLGSVQVRASGTIGGNIANGSPIGDSPPLLIALGAQLVLGGPQGPRFIALEDFFLEYGKQDLAADEFVEAIIVPRRKRHQRLTVAKVSKRESQDITAVLAAVSETHTGTRMAFGGMAGIPKLAQQTMASGDTEDLAKDFQPLSDARASAAYRLGVAKQIVDTHQQNLATEAWRQPTSQEVQGPAFIGTKIGEANPHDSAPAHTRGDAPYTDDIPEPQGCLHAALGLGPKTSGAILALDLAAVRAAPGVRAVITASHIPGENNVGPVVHDDPLLAEHTLAFAQQPVFMVLADTREQARRAAVLGRIEVKANPEPVVSIEQTVEAEQRLHDDLVLLEGHAEMEIDSAEQCVQGEILIGGQEHFYLEGQVALAIPSTDGLHVVSSTQHPTEVQDLVSAALNVSAAEVTVEVRRMGGAFGGKESQAAQTAVLAALGAQITGKAVKLRLDRDEDMVTTGKRHDFFSRYQLAYEDKGRITAGWFELSSRCGFSNDLSKSINDRAVFHSDNAYFLPEVAIHSKRLKSDTVSNTAFRGFGGPQGMVAIERGIDKIAAELKVDPLDVRLENLYGQHGMRTPYGMMVDEGVLIPLVRQLAGQSDYRARRSKIMAHNSVKPRYIRGIALTPIKFGISFTASFLNQAGALLNVYKDGSVIINHGGTEMGQGLYLKVAQIVASRLGISLDRIKPSSTRTDKVPNTSPTAASSGTDLNGMAAQVAADEIRSRLAQHLQERFGLPKEPEFADNHIKIGRHRVSFADACRSAWMARIPLSATGHFATPGIGWDPKTGKGQPFYYFTHGASVSEVEVDTVTGAYHVTQVDILHDVGKSINPALDLGQIEGGFIQGMGWLTMEELVYSNTGQLLTHAPSTYKIPAAADRPKVMNIRLWDGENSRDTVYRSKAVGEPPLMLALSVHSALAHAVSTQGPKGWWPDMNTPATPEEVWRCLSEAKALA